MVTKLAAARLATASGTTVVIANGRVPNVLVRLAGGEALGTTFPSTASHLESRQRWMLSVISSTGALVVDGGAVAALSDHGRSLLPAGVQGVRGAFQRGEVVPVIGPEGGRVAAGIVNYEADDVRRILGVRSDRITEALGHHYGDEIIHRDNMVRL
jgi:glutamate 5-kinase